MPIRKSSIGGIPFGGTSDRPSSPVKGQLFYNGDLAATEIYTGTQWVVMGAIPSFATIGTAADVGANVAYGSGSVNVGFTPSSSGGLATTFIATSSPGGIVGSGPASPVRVNGLTQGTSYTFTVVASNAYGNAATTAPSNSVTPTSVPQAPTIGTAMGQNGRASVSFTPNANGGKEVTLYTVTSSPGNITASGASSPITVTGLTNGTSYTFTVTATNANGTSAPSAVSNSTTPASPFAVDYLVVAGGGGGAGGFSGGNGGGGAGGFRTSAGTSGGNSAAEPKLSVERGTFYTVTVGAGGSNNAVPGAGSDSVFSTVTSFGGGRGGFHNGSVAGGGGGSGAGGSAGSSVGGAGGSGTAGQGFAGGSGAGGSTSGGGGGGAGAIGGNGGGGGGNGGNGTPSSITGSSVTYAGGGGGASFGTPGSGGSGGGGGGGGGTCMNFSGGSGAANTGSGGGGGTNACGGQNSGGFGGSGIVILRWPTASGTISIGAGLSGSTSTVGSDTVATITGGTGTVSFS